MIRRRTMTTAAPISAPTSAPPPASTTNCTVPCHSTLPQPAATELPTAKDTAIWNSTRLVPSLNRLSACTRACTRGGSASRRPSALTATGSVLASTAPSTNAIAAGTAATADSTTATAAAEASTRPTARTTTGRHTARRSRPGRSLVAAHSRGGSTTKLTTSGVTRTAGTPGIRPTTSPATTSSEGAGTRSRFANAAPTVPSATRASTISALRTPPAPSARPSPHCRPGFPAHHQQPYPALPRPSWKRPETQGLPLTDPRSGWAGA